MHGHRTRIFFLYNRDRGQEDPRYFHSLTWQVQLLTEVLASLALENLEFKERPSDFTRNTLELMDTERVGARA
jgi:hypothetical protein